jgi:hypothetical protein
MAEIMFNFQWGEVSELFSVKSAAVAGISM